MFELLPESAENCIGIRVSGKVAAKDYDMLLPKLDEATEVHGKINLLVHNFEGWEGLDDAKADFRLGTRQYHHNDHRVRIAERQAGQLGRSHNSRRNCSMDRRPDLWQMASLNTDCISSPNSARNRRGYRRSRVA